MADLSWPIGRASGDAVQSYQNSSSGCLWQVHWSKTKSGPTVPKSLSLLKWWIEKWIFFRKHWKGLLRCAARCLCSRCLMILIIGTFQDKGSVILPHWSCLYPKRCQCWQYCDNARARNLCQAFSAALAVVQSALSEQSSTCLYKTGILSSEKLLAHQDFFF